MRIKQLNGYQFYRQKPLGNYVIDFYCPKAKLVIEVDGSQHFSGKNRKSDKARDKFLSDLGLKVIRFNNIDVLTNIEGVVENILENMKAATKPGSRNPP